MGCLVSLWNRRPAYISLHNTTAQLQVHWGQHLLRPEFVESTYFLYRATRDPHYLEVGCLTDQRVD